MKRSIIILLVLIVLFAMPVLASTPEQENAPMASEDELFLGQMSQLSEEELTNIVGNAHSSITDGASNITITGGSATQSGSITVGVGSSTTGTSVTLSASSNYNDGYTWFTDPETGITTYTYVWTSNGTIYSTTWQVNNNAGNYPSASTSTHTSGYLDAGASMI